MQKSKLQRRYGWLPDKKDLRDVRYAASQRRNLFDLPEILDLRSVYMPPVFDQGQLGSCTANAIAGAYAYVHANSAQIESPNWAGILLSRLFIYFNERSMEGTIASDAGAFIRDGIKTMNLYGACLENIWPYEPYTFTNKPSDDAYTEAKNHLAVAYQSVRPTSQDVITALADGYPVVFGFTVYESFESPEVAATGEMPFPKPAESALGGHAVLAVGFDQAKQHLIVRNSWGSGWGQNGYFTMPFSCIEPLCSDFWILTSVK